MCTYTCFALGNLIFFNIMFVLFIILLLIANISGDLVCPAREYANSRKGCLPCVTECEVCTGPSTTDCINCSEGYCKNEKNECKPCNLNDKKRYERPTKIIKDNIPYSKNEEKSDEKIELLLWILIIVISLFTIFFASILLLFILKWRCQKRSSFKNLEEQQPCLNNNNNNNEAVATTSMSIELETMPDNIFLEEVFPFTKLNNGSLLKRFKQHVGHGRFGTIYKCPYVQNGRFIWVAYKTTNHMNREASREVEALNKLSHINIIELKNMNVKDDLILVMPLRQSDLKVFLKNNESIISRNHQIRYCMQIADACRYMIINNILHCDLKTSNVLVVNINHVEVSDFGLCTDLHGGHGIRAMGTITHVAKELYTNPISVTCEATDVWSFGVTTWEIFTFNRHEKPYAEELKNQNYSEMELMNYLEQGNRLTISASIKSDIGRIMTACWIGTPMSRPTFNQIFLKFSKLLPEGYETSKTNTLDA